MKLKTFKIGGVHPPENKLSSYFAIESIDPPKEVTILLNQHIGTPATPVVKKGDRVKVGTLIGKGETLISANIHSSVSGTVKKIEDVKDSRGYLVPAVMIAVEGDEWESSIDRSPDVIREITISVTDIQDKIKDAGIVGLGGAAFPTQVKYLPSEDKKIDTLVINGVECEPYLTADHRLMLERSEELLVGIEILKKALNLSQAIIGIEANKKDAIELLSEKVQNYSGIQIVPLKVQYPQGAEKQLIKAALDREVPSGKLPLDVGCVVNNVGTIFAVYEAVQKNKPLIERVITVTGKYLIRTGNFLTRIGTPIADLINVVGGMPQNTRKIISGGPMMGQTVILKEAPITKATSGVLLLSHEQSFRKSSSNCIRCARCVSACPMGLEPYLLESLATKKKWDEAEQEHALDCMECGSCSYICPSHHGLLDYIRLAKATIIKNKKKGNK